MSTEFREYNSIGSERQGSHPIAFEIDGVEYECGTEARINALELGKTNGSFCELCSDPRIDFKVTSEWNNCDINGLKICWRVPVGAVPILGGLPLSRDDYTQKELALLKIHLLVYRKELRAARAEYVCPAYIKSLEELMKRIEEEIEGAI